MTIFYKLGDNKLGDNISKCYVKLKKKVHTQKLTNQSIHKFISTLFMKVRKLWSSGNAENVLIEK